MRDPYQVLGISPGAPDDEVKRAFRQLAKQLHPDLHPNDASADLRFREIVSAYQALSNPHAHAEDDAARRSVRRRRWAGAATAASVFLATVGSIAVVVLWRQWDEAPSPAWQGSTQPLPVESGGSPISATPSKTGRIVGTPGSESANAGPPVAEPADPKERSNSAELESHSPQPRSGALIGQNMATPADAPPRVGASEPARDPPLASEEHRADAAVSEKVAPAETTAAMSFAAPTSTRALTWTNFRNARFGFSLAYPSDVLLSDPAPSDEGAVFRSRDGRARLIVSAGAAAGTTLAAHRRSLMSGPYKSAVLDYAPRRPYWFVLSGMLGDEIFYQRVTFSCDGLTFHSWKLTYPQAERALYDRIVEGVHRRYSHGNGPGARCDAVSQ